MLTSSDLTRTLNIYIKVCWVQGFAELTAQMWLALAVPLLTQIGVEDLR